VVVASDEGDLACGGDHASTLDAGGGSRRAADCDAVHDGHLVDGGLGDAGVVALHGVLGADDAQVAGFAKVVLGVVAVVELEVLAVELPDVGEVDVEGLLGGAGQEEGLVDVGGHYLELLVVGAGAVHHV